MKDKDLRDKLCLMSECTFDNGCGCLEAIAQFRASITEAERERCARIVEGDVYKDRYRTWPCIGDGNRGEDSDLVKYFLDPLAAAIRRGVSPIAGEREGQT